jgi:SPP1 family predicted phage head-tail adaptor
MRAGRLRHLITLQANTASQVGLRPAQTWTNQAEFFARIEPVSGLESFRQAKVQAETTHIVTVRYDPSHEVTTKMRWMFGSRVFGILSARKTDERDIEIVCDCKEEL